MKIAIIDDKLMNLQLLQKMLEDLPHSITHIFTATTIDQGVELLETHEPELLFLDIEMGSGYGFEILERSAYQKFELIFVSAHPQFALKSYDYNPIHYLLKPITEEDLEEGMQRYFHRHDAPSKVRKSPSFSSKQNSTKKRISLPENGRIRFVDIEDIVYLESSNVYTIFHLEGRSPIVVSKALASYETLLPEAIFYRIHDRYMVNLKHIQSYTRGRGGEVELSNGTELTVATRRKQEFLQKMQALSLG
ncbi:MAG: LytTR family DNA-binding domain-containing protein [Bacteroidota bacterium]